MVLLEDLLETCELGSIVQCLEVCIYLIQRGCGTVVETLPSAPIFPRHHSSETCYLGTATPWQEDHASCDQQS